MLIMLALVAGELADAGQRRWWAGRPLTTDTAAGLLVLLVTVLVVNQLLNRRQARQRGHTVVAQATIVAAPAVRSARAVSSVIGGSGNRGAASDGLRTYMMMLLIGAPVLIGDPVARRFWLCQPDPFQSATARRFLGQPSTSAEWWPHAHGDRQVAEGAATPGDRPDEAMQQLQSAAVPLIELLSR
jgi:hypothetical protein